MQLGWRDATVNHAKQCSSRWSRLTPCPCLYLLVEFGLSSELPSMVDTRVDASRHVGPVHARLKSFARSGFR